MKLTNFRVRNYRNIVDSGHVSVNQLTAFVGQNESGKTNLCEALFKLNPFDGKSIYNIDEDWPADNWGGKDLANIVCEAEFELTSDESVDAVAVSFGGAEPSSIPESMRVRVGRRYDMSWTIEIQDRALDLDPAKLQEWIVPKLPKCVFIQDYLLSGAQTELDRLAAKYAQGWNTLTPEEQTIVTILELARTDIAEIVGKGSTPEGRTLRSFDLRQASIYLTAQFAKLWGQKKVEFKIEIDATTLNILVEDDGFGMPVRLNRRSTGFRWYVSFAWMLTKATDGQYRDCIILLEEPGIHLHHDGHRDLLALFEQLSESNTLIYTTHLATMLDAGFPERVRIVEVRDHHTVIVNGMVSTQKRPMMVIEARLGLAGSMGGLLGDRQTLIVEGGSDAVILQKLSAVLQRSGREGLSDRIYLFPADGAPKTPMYAGFLIGQNWDSGVLLDSDKAGDSARTKIAHLYPEHVGAGARFRIFMLGKAAGIREVDAAIEDIFPDDFYLECVNEAYGIAIKKEDLPDDLGPMLTKRVEYVLQEKHGRSELDKALVMTVLLRRFATWTDESKLPAGTADFAEKLFKKINAAFSEDSTLRAPAPSNRTTTRRKV